MLVSHASGTNRNTTLNKKELSFEEFSQWFQVPMEGEKNTVGYFIRGGDLKLTDEGLSTEHYHRNNHSLKSADLLILDIDKGQVSPSSMHARLDRLGLST